MSDSDRFSDLGGDQQDGRSAAERFEEQDRINPEPDTPPPKRPEVPRAGNKYAWAVGIVLVMLISVLLLRAVVVTPGAPGLDGPPRGQVMPDFAAPLATGTVEGDANVCQAGGECTGETSGPIPACEVRADGVFNVCDARKRPLVLTFVFDRGADCNPQVDRVQRMKDDFPGVGFPVVYFSDEDRKEVREIVLRRKWTMPVAHTNDGAVVNLYGVGGCPTTVFAKAGGRVVSTKLGPLSEADLRRQVRAVARRS